MTYRASRVEHRDMRVFLVAMFIGSLVGCDRGSSSSPSPSASSSPSAASTVAAAISHAHDEASSAPAASSTPNPWTDHQHGAPHGGHVRTAASGHLELKVASDGQLVLWILDVHQKPTTAKGAKGSVRLASMGGNEVPLTYDAAKDALTAKLPALQPGLTTVIEVKIKLPNGEDATVRFNPMPG